MGRSFVLKVAPSHGKRYDDSPKTIPCNILKYNYIVHYVLKTQVPSQVEKLQSGSTVGPSTCCIKEESIVLTTEIIYKSISNYFLDSQLYQIY